MKTYKDMILKANYYKEQIVNSFIRKGYFPNESDISERLSLIETRTALCETYLSKAGSYFNTKEFNYMFEMIYKDLNYLYKILEDILTNEYNNLKIYIETHLNELEAKSNTFKNRLEEEFASTSLGNNIFFKTNNWNVTTNDEDTIIDLGELELYEGSKIVVLANINNIEGNNVSFKFINDKPDYSFNALPYNYNNNIYTIPGKLEVKEYDLNLKDKVIVNDNIEINLDVNIDNDYKVLGGKNCMSITYENGYNEIVNFATSSSVFYAESDCYIEFYCYNKPSIEYSFNKKPLHCNFPISDNNIYIEDKKPKKIYMKVSAGFMCYFNVENGEIWASCTDGIVNTNNTLLYSGNWNLRDFKILEYIKSNRIIYNVKMHIKSSNDIIQYINSVSIKELE